jgi:hypothetical protein
MPAWHELDRNLLAARPVDLKPDSVVARRELIVGSVSRAQVSSQSVVDQDAIGPTPVDPTAGCSAHRQHTPIGPLASEVVEGRPPDALLLRGYTDGVPPQRHADERGNPNDRRYQPGDDVHCAKSSQSRSEADATLAPRASA